MAKSVYGSLSGPGEVPVRMILAQVVSLALLAVSGPAFADAVVVRLYGTATAWTGDEPRRELREGDAVKGGEFVATVGVDSFVSLRLEDKSTVTLRGNTVMRVKSQCAPGDPTCPEKSVVDQVKGKGRFQSKTPAPGPNLAKPTGLAALRWVTCTTDTERFRDVAPAVFTDQTTQLLWAKCPYGQDFDSESRNCRGSITVTERLDVARAIASSLARDTGSPWRLPTIEEISALAAATCGTRFFGKTPLSDYGGAPVWTGSLASGKKAYQFDPAKGGRTAEAEDNAPGIIILVTERLLPGK